MRRIQASDAEAQLARLLDAVERGETVIITRDGKPIARLVPAADRRQAEVERVLAEIEEFRKTMPSIPLEEILSARHEGRPLATLDTALSIAVRTETAQLIGEEPR
jgi:prevent-host-death family protein